MVDERHILIEFGGDVEQSVVFVVDHAMGTDAVAEVDMADDLREGKSMTSISWPLSPGMPTPTLP